MDDAMSISSIYNYSKNLVEKLEEILNSSNIDQDEHYHLLVDVDHQLAILKNIELDNSKFDKIENFEEELFDEKTDGLVLSNNAESKIINLKDKLKKLSTKLDNKLTDKITV